MAAFTIVAVIMAAAVIDLGGLRAEKKEVTLSTDAAALAAAQVIDFSDPAATGNNVPCSAVRADDATHGNTVEDVADHYLTINGESVLGSCAIFFGPTGTNSAYLTVTADDDVDFTFGKALGANGGSVSGTSSARVGSASVDDVYPIGVCSLDEVVTFVNDDEDFPQYFDGLQELTMDFGNSNCGGAGNHEQIDFLGDPPPGACDATGQFCYDLNNGGFDGTVPPTIGSNPGQDWALNAVSDPLEDLRDRQVHIWVPAVGPVVNDGGGNPAYFPVQYFVEVVITRFEPTGSDSGMDLEVYQVVDYDYYEDNDLPMTTVNREVQAHICATSADTSGCTTNPPLGSPPPPPPPPEPCTVLSTVAPPVVNVDTSGESTVPLTVNVTVADQSDCDLVTLDAVSSTSSVAAPAPTTALNQYTFVFPRGTAFSAVNGTVFNMVVSEDGEVRHSSTAVTVVAPTCAVTSVTPTTETVPVSGNGVNRKTTQARTWTVNIANPQLCGAVTGEIKSPPDTKALTGSSTATATMTFTLPQGTALKHNAYSVRFFNAGVLIDSSASLTTTG